MGISRLKRCAGQWRLPGREPQHADSGGDVAGFAAKGNKDIKKSLYDGYACFNVPLRYQACMLMLDASLTMPHTSI
jgi:hypothetical protein